METDLNFSLTFGLNSSQNSSGFSSENFSQLNCHPVFREDLFLYKSSLELLDDVCGLVQPGLVCEDGREGRVLAGQELVEVAHQAQGLVVAGPRSVHRLQLGTRKGIW